MGLDPVSFAPVTPVAPVAPPKAPAQAPIADSGTPGPAPQNPADPGFSPTSTAAQDDYGAMPWANVPGLTPDGEAAVASLDQQGRLDASRNGAATLRDRVDAYLGDGGDPAVASEVLLQLACPENIAQVAGKNTCTSAAVQASIAESDPARYFDMATQLHDKGVATLPDGQVLRVSPANRAAVDGLEGDLCQKISGSVQAALMDYANGDKPYDFAKDRTEGLEGETKGLDREQFDRLNKDLLGAVVFSTESSSFSAIKREILMERDGGSDDGDDRPTPASAALELRDTVNAAQHNGQEVLVTLKGSAGAYHVVHLKNVTGSDVKVENPLTGEVETMNITSFVRRVGDPWRPGTFVGEGGGSATTTSGSRTRTATPLPST